MDYVNILIECINTLQYFEYFRLNNGYSNKLVIYCNRLIGDINKYIDRIKDNDVIIFYRDRPIEHIIITIKLLKYVINKHSFDSDIEQYTFTEYDHILRKIREHIRSVSNDNESDRDYCQSYYMKYIVNDEQVA